MRTPAKALPSPIAAEALHELDLPRVVEIVRRRAHHQRQVVESPSTASTGEGVLGQRGHGVPQRVVHVEEQPHIAPPLRHAGTGRRGPDEPVRARQRKRAALFAQESTPHDVLPVGRVHHQLPDVVPPWLWAPGRIGGAEAADRSAQVRTVPRPVVERFVQHAEQHIASHARGPRAVRPRLATRRVSSWFKGQSCGHGRSLATATRGPEPAGVALVGPGANGSLEGVIVRRGLPPRRRHARR